MRLFAALLAVVTLLGLAPAANACSRVTWLGPDGMVITGRSMDWPYSFHSHLYAVPAGSEQDGGGGADAGSPVEADSQQQQVTGKCLERPGA